MKIQVIGLPGSGKSSFLRSYIKERGVHYIDVVDFSFMDSFRKAIETGPDSLIAESACGVISVGSCIVQLIQPREVLVRNLNSRNESFDLEYWSLLETQMLRPHYRAYSGHDLYSILDKTLWRV